MIARRAPTRVPRYSVRLCNGIHGQDVRNSRWVHPSLVRVVLVVSHAVQTCRASIVSYKNWLLSFMDVVEKLFDAEHVKG